MRPLPPLLLTACAACVGEIGPVPPPPGPGDFTWRVEAVEPLTLEHAQWPLGADAGGRFHVAVARGQLLLGTGDGLELLGSDGGTALLSAAPVHGLITQPGGDALVAGPDGLKVLTGELLRESALGEAFTTPPRLLTREGDALWLSTDAELVRLENGQLTAWAVAGVTALHAHGGLRTARAAAGWLLLRDAPNGALELQSLSEELELEAALPVGGGETLGATPGGAAVRRVAVDGGAAWLEVALAAGAQAEPARGVRLLGVDPQTGAAWLWHQGALGRLDGRRLSTLAAPEPAGAQVGESGALFLSSASELVRLGSDAPVRFAESIEPLSAAQCESCHRQGGAAQPVLETPGDWRDAIDRVLERTDPLAAEALRMPRGASPLTAAQYELIRRWKQEGFRP